MTKRVVKKEAYRLIVREHKSHQEAFEELSTKVSISKEELAEELAKIPTKNKLDKFKTLTTIYIGVLGIVIAIRGLSIVLLGFESQIDMKFLGIIFVIGILIPAFGIYSMLTSRIESLKTVGIVLIIAVLRSFSEVKGDFEPISLLFLIPFIAAIALSFHIPTKLKTSYSKKVNKQEIDGKVQAKTSYIFDNDSNVLNPELVDDFR